MTRSTARAGATAVAAAFALAPAAAGQFLIDMEPPAYSGSPAGEPLAGQDGWEVESGSAETWRVHTSGMDPYRLPPNPRGEAQFAAADGSAGPAIVRREVSDIRTWLLAEVAVAHFGAVAVTPEIGSWSLEPQDESASFALHAVWSDPMAPGKWHVEVTYYAADGVRHRAVAPGLEDLEPGRWYRWVVALGGENEIVEVLVEDLTQFTTWSHKPAGWYLRGGAAGGLPQPTAVAIGSTSERGEDAVFALDNVRSRASYWGYFDCDRDGRWDFFDFLCFQDAFASGAAWADCDGSGQLDFFDFLCFQDCHDCF